MMNGSLPLTTQPSVIPAKAGIPITGWIPMFVRDDSLNSCCPNKARLVRSFLLMESIIEFLKTLHTPEGIMAIISKGGLIALIGIVFAETGLLVGFFLPGDSLLVTAGIVAATKGPDGAYLLDIWTVNVSLAIAAIVGDQLGYFLGFKTGHAIFNRPDSRFFKKKHAESAHEFYVKYGPVAIILARFVPIMRTFVPFIAGVAEMPYKKYLAWDILGGAIWITSLVWIGYGLGHTPLAKKLHHVILIVVFVSLLPLIIGSMKAFLAQRKNK
jgi:membrane-associated protein